MPPRIPRRPVTIIPGQDFLPLDLPTEPLGSIVDAPESPTIAVSVAPAPAELMRVAERRQRLGTTMLRLHPDMQDTVSPSFSIDKEAYVVGMYQALRNLGPALRNRSAVQNNSARRRIRRAQGRGADEYLDRIAEKGVRHEAEIVSGITIAMGNAALDPFMRQKAVIQFRRDYGGSKNAAARVRLKAELTRLANESDIRLPEFDAALV